MMTDKQMELVTRLVLLLDAALPLFDADARREEARERGKILRQITARERAKAARETVAKASGEFGVDLDD